MPTSRYTIGPVVGRLGGILALTVLTCLSGCNKPSVDLYEAKGRVNFTNGAVVKFGQVEIYCDELDLTAYGPIQKDGTFQLGTFEPGDGAPEGRHKAVVMQLILPSKLGVNPHHHGAHVAAKYADYETSELEIEIKPQSNEIQIVVESVRR